MAKTISPNQKAVTKANKGIHSANYQIQLRTTFSDFIQDFQKIHEALIQLNYVPQKYYRNSGIKQQNFIQDLFREIQKDPSLLPHNITVTELQQLEEEMENLLEGKRYLDQILKQWANKMYQIANAQGTLASQVYSIIKGRALTGDAEMQILVQKLSLYHRKQKNGQQQEILKGNFNEQGDFNVTQKTKTKKKHRTAKETLFTIPQKDMKS